LQLAVGGSRKNNTWSRIKDETYGTNVVARIKEGSEPQTVNRKPFQHCALRIGANSL
jgi:hypothetical protein